MEEGQNRRASSFLTQLMDFNFFKGEDLLYFSVLRMSNNKSPLIMCYIKSRQKFRVNLNPLCDSNVKSSLLSSCSCLFFTSESLQFFPSLTSGINQRNFCSQTTEGWKLGKQRRPVPGPVEILANKNYHGALGWGRPGLKVEQKEP